MKRPSELWCRNISSTLPLFLFWLASSPTPFAVGLIDHVEWSFVFPYWSRFWRFQCIAWRGRFSPFHQAHLCSSICSFDGCLMEDLQNGQRGVPKFWTELHRSSCSWNPGRSSTPWNSSSPSQIDRQWRTLSSPTWGLQWIARWNWHGVRFKRTRSLWPGTVEGLYSFWVSTGQWEATRLSCQTCVVWLKSKLWENRARRSLCFHMVAEPQWS